MRYISTLLCAGSGSLFNCHPSSARSSPHTDRLLHLSRLEKLYTAAMFLLEPWQPIPKGDRKWSRHAQTLLQLGAMRATCVLCTHHATTATERTSLSTLKKIQFEEPYSFLAVLSDYFCRSLVIQVGISTLMSSTYSTHVLAGLVSNGT
jgi:hypothetical protein